MLRRVKPLRRLLHKWPLYARLSAARKVRRRARWRRADNRYRTFYAQFIRRGDLVFDLGANMGGRSRVFLKLGARVVAFEPQDVCRQLLAETFGPKRGFTLVEKAVGEAPGTLEMRTSQVNELSSLSPAWIERMRQVPQMSMFEWDGTQTVEVTTLDLAIAEHGLPAFTKIDVEGFEREVFAGLSQPLPCLSFEYHLQDLQRARDCLARLRALDTYEYQHSLGESLAFELDAWAGEAEVLEDLERLLAADSELCYGDVYARLCPSVPENSRM